MLQNKKNIQFGLQLLLQEDSEGRGLVRAFTQPFTDAFQTTIAALETASSKAEMLLGLTGQVILSSFIPFLEVDYKAFLKQDRARMDKIASKYESVFARTDEALQGDAKGIAFILFPEAILAKKLTDNLMAAGSSDLVKSTTNSGLELIDALTYNMAEPLTDKIRDLAGIDHQRKNEGKSIKLIEKDNTRLQDIVSKISAAIKHPKIKSAIANSPIAKKMQVDGLAAMAESLRDIEKRIDAYKNIKSPADFEKLTGTKLELENKQKVDAVEFKKVLEAELPKIITKAISQYTAYIIKQRQDYISLAKSAGIPLDDWRLAKVIKLHDETLNKIKK